MSSDAWISRIHFSVVRFGASHLSLCRIDGNGRYVAVQRRNKLSVKEHNGQDENISVLSPLPVAGFFVWIFFPKSFAAFL